ncbi:MaoC/PaaZ C-terminal domain-containing protein [Kocuria sp. ZOR0020]|uniref:MaoC family dehydratase n=1 Tax=Kocuria sp. ZOR0020 TaxID=1339234 RepID=UPI000647436B|nr:MaoC/PaaZ C-terminal domain-containing protein [Kocuria sp. ZOR0020]
MSAHDLQPARQKILLESMPSLGGMYAKAAGQLVGRGATAGVRRALRSTPLPLPGRSGATRRRTTLRLPNIQIQVPGVKVEAHGNSAFCQVVEAPVRVDEKGREVAFSGYLHALAFPAAMALLTRDDFPLPTVGLVHLSNHVHHTQQVLVGESLDVTVWAQDLRKHRAGAAVDVVVELRRSPRGNDDDARGAGMVEPVWTGRSVYLARGVQLSSEAGGETASGESQQRPEFTPPVPTARWSLGADTGRRYAAVSGDVNPIHLSGPSAKALGMKGAIAHGMYTASRALAMVGAQAPMTWEVEFHTPLVLPSSVAVAVDRTGRAEGLREATVTVWNAKKRKPHATLTVQR